MPRLGIISELHINEGSTETPDWTEADLVGDCSVNGDWNKGNSTARISRVDTEENTTLKLAITGNIRVESGDPAYEALRDAFVGDVVVDVLALNGPIDENGVEGWRFDGKVGSFSEDQNRDSVIFRSFTITPCASDNLPQFVRIAGGVPVYSDIGEVPT